jgi:hypothetical protein
MFKESKASRALGGRRRLSLMPKDNVTNSNVMLDEKNENSEHDNGSIELSTRGTVLTTAGLRVENITPCFVSRHVKALCDANCWDIWKEAADNCAVAPFQQIDEMFSEKMERFTGMEMKPSRNEHFAAVVMADVSGYSKLSSSLAGRGAEGAEILCRTMKGYLDKVYPRSNVP